MRSLSVIALGSVLAVGCGTSGNGSLFGPNGGAGGSVLSNGAGGVGTAGGAGGVSANGNGGAVFSSAGGANSGGFPAADASTGSGGAIGGQLLDATAPRPLDGGREPFGVATPGAVLCAGAECTLTAFPSNTCCVGALPFPTACFPTFPGCVNDVIATISCDDSTDCSNGQICCGTLNGQTFGASCDTSCKGSAFQVCRTPGECASQTCEPMKDAPGYGRCK